jgi:hypothetical protein
MLENTIQEITTVQLAFHDCKIVHIWHYLILSSYNEGKYSV